MEAEADVSRLSTALAESQAEVERRKVELHEANQWRERHCADAKAYGERNQRLADEVSRFRAENERLSVAGERAGEAAEEMRGAIIAELRRRAMPSTGRLIAKLIEAINAIPIKGGDRE